MDDNNFNSTIFSSLKIFPSLKHLNLAANEINGNVEMNGLFHIQVFSTKYINFISSNIKLKFICVDIIDLSNLEYLDLSDNNIHSFATTKGTLIILSSRHPTEQKTSLWTSCNLNYFYNLLKIAGYKLDGTIHSYFKMFMIYLFTI